MNENEKSVRRRDWVKNFAIIFLSIMLVLTFFSNTIMNYSLPEVATEYVQTGTITEKVRGTGTIEATDPYSITVSESRLVSSVAVKVGDKVEKDAPLFYLEDEESTELMEAQKELNTLILAYQLAVITENLEVGTVNNIENENTKSLTQKQQTLQAAINSVDTLQNSLDLANAEVVAINKELGYIGNTVADTSGEKSNLSNAQKEANNASQSVADAKSQQDTAQKNLDLAKAKIEPLTKEVEAAGAAVAAMQGIKSKIDNYSTNLADATRVYSEKEAAYTNAKNEKDRVDQEHEAWKAGAGLTASAKEKQDWLDLVDRYAKDLEAKNTELEAAKNNLASVESEYQAALSQYSDEALNQLIQQAANKENDLNAAKNDVTNYTNQIQNLINDVAAKEAEQRNKDNAVSNAEQSLKDKENSVDTTVSKANTSNRLLEAEARQKKAQADFDRAQEEMTKIQKELLAEINLESQNEVLDLQLQKIKKLEEKAIGATINSPVAGTVTEVKLVAGEKTKPEEPLAVIQVDGKGFTLSISATTEQAKKLQVGDIAELQSAWYYDEVKVVLAAIKPDPNEPAQKKLLVFNVEGEVQAGQSLSISVGQRSSNYELVVPNSAIREDKNGKFILTVESRNSPLGNRYIATKVDVEVLASDDTHTAISAGLFGYEYVITTATKPVEAGKQVRLTD